MKRLVLTIASLALATVALAAAADAGPATDGRLVVVNPMTRAGSLGGITIHAVQAPNTYKTIVYVPAGYRAAGGLGAVGNTVGKATVFFSEGDGRRVTLNGTLTAADPAQYASDACGSDLPKHSAVWLLTASKTASSTSASIPVFVDSTATTDTADSPWASYRLEWCARTSSGFPVREVDLSLVKMLDNPQRRGMYTWRAVFVPLAADGTGADAANSVSVASAVPVSPQVTLKAKRLSPLRVLVTGRVQVVRHPLGGIRVQVYAGPQKRLRLSRPRAVVRTRADGTYRVVLHLRKGYWWLRAEASTPYRDITPGGGCTPSAGTPTLGGRGCVDATLSPFVIVSKPVTHVS